jgi:hypothetical protein
VHLLFLTVSLSCTALLYSNTLWALGTARVSPNCRNTFDTVLLPSSLRPSADEVRNDPVTSIFGDAAQELIRRPQEFKPQEIKDVLLAFVWTETRHPLLFQAVAEHLVGSKDRPEMCGRGLDDFNSQGIANLAYSFARHTQLGVDVLERYKTKCRIPVTGGRLAAYTTSYLDIGEGLLRKLFSEIAEYCIQNQGEKCCCSFFASSCDFISGTKEFCASHCYHPPPPPPPSLPSM